MTAVKFKEYSLWCVYIPIQQEIIKKYFDAKDGANNYYAKADECKTNALINFEKEIF